MERGTIMIESQDGVARAISSVGGQGEDRERRLLNLKLIPGANRGLLPDDDLDTIEWAHAELSLKIKGLA